MFRFSSQRRGKPGHGGGEKRGQFAAGTKSPTRRVRPGGDGLGFGAGADGLPRLQKPLQGLRQRHLFRSCKIGALACPMAFRSMPDFAIHCTAGIIGEAGSVLSRTRQKRVHRGLGLWLALAKRCSASLTRPIRSPTCHHEMNDCVVVGEGVRAFAETLQDFVAAPIAHGLRDQKNLILRQRFASRFRHPLTFEHDRFKLKGSCSFF
jgi:hypothetical protein